MQETAHSSSIRDTPPFPQVTIAKTQATILTQLIIGRALKNHMKLILRSITTSTATTNTLITR
jgi:hypothetical protein